MFMEDDRMPSLLGQRVKKTKENKFGFVDVDLNKLTIDCPTVLCLGGGYVVGRKMANGMAKFVVNLLHTNVDENFKVYSLVYGSYESSPMTPSVTKEELDAVANKLFVPLVSKQGERIDTKTAQKNMRNLTIVSHCFGASVANQLAVIIKNKMVELGYSLDETASILKQITNISYAPFKKEANTLFSGVDFYSLKDKYKSYFPDIENRNKDMFASTTLNTKENCLTVVADSVFDGNDNIFDEHLVDLLIRDENWKLRASENIKQGKGIELNGQLPINLNKTKDELFSRADTMSVCFGLCVAESVSNSFENQQTKKLIQIDLKKLQKSIDFLIEEESKKEKNALVGEEIVDYVQSKKELKNEDNNSKSF